MTNETVIRQYWKEHAYKSTVSESDSLSTDETFILAWLSRHFVTVSQWNVKPRLLYLCDRLCAPAISRAVEGYRSSGNYYRPLRSFIKLRTKRTGKILFLFFFFCCSKINFIIFPCIEFGRLGTIFFFFGIIRRNTKTRRFFFLFFFCCCSKIKIERLETNNFNVFVSILSQHET